MAQEPTVDPVGGQALLGGVMMRSGDHWAGAVRRADGRIQVIRQVVRPVGGRLRSVPFVRGSLALLESVLVGLKATVWSSDVRAASQAELEGDDDGGLSKVGVVISMVIGVTFAITLFGLAPAVIAEVIGPEGSVAFSVVETVIRLVLLVAYLALLTRSQDLRKVFAYHGAEHKTVNAHEHGDPLTVAAVRGHSRRHGRCGTTFLLMVAVLATVVHIAIGKPSFGVLLASRVLLLPVVAGLAYELIRFTNRPGAGRVAAALRRPGYLLQDLTTREPADDEIEVAIAALLVAIDRTPDGVVVTDSTELAA